MNESATQPPHYILVSHTCQYSAAAVPSTTLSHPIIQYHYADDTPVPLLPTSPDEPVLVLDYDPSQPTTYRAQSIGGSISVTGVRVTDAPGAIAIDEEPQRSNQMYILETTALCDEKYEYRSTRPSCSC